MRPPVALMATALLLAFGAQLELWTRLPGSKPLLVATALCFTLPLIAARAYPVPAVAVAIIAIDVEALFAPAATREAGAPLAAGLAAAYLIALYGSRREAIAMLAFSGITVVLVARDSTSFASGAVTFVFTAALLAAAWGIGIALHDRRRRADVAEGRAALAERERDVVARLAVAEERARIARELHDVVAHSVSVMVLRTGAVRHKLPIELADEASALREVEQTGRAALAEMRHLLGALRNAPELAPQPGISRLPSLAETITQAGLPVELLVVGDPATLPAGIDLSTYRIVQEALTNALKHAHAHRAEVRLTYSPSDLQIEVRDDGIGPSPNDDAGHGLIGIRERVKIYDGEVETAAREGGGFVLRVRFPTQSYPR